MNATEGSIDPPASRIRALWNAIVGAIAGLVGLAPHVLHHVGLLAGVALVAGTAGTIMFGILGLVASIPLLVRLHRRFDTWRAPAIALAIFAAMFALSSFVIGPALTDDGGSTPSPAGHDQHH